MCAIAGILGRIGPDNRAALARMNAAMAHRGPDGDGIWEAPPDARGLGVMLLHRRLAILDLSPSGAQPMHDPLTNDAIVLNGEIYNYLQLRALPGAYGEQLPSTGDTAVALRMLGLEGCRAIPKLRGMFAIAFWDSSERKLTLARDALGIKPLYICYNPDPNGQWTVAFASEVRALLASGLLGQAKLNPNAVASVLWSGFMVAPETAVVGIESLLPGQYRVFSASGAEESRVEFWSAAKTASAERQDDRPLADILQESVRLHLTSDVPVGVFLSGGVDSSVVANLAQRALGQPVNTYTLAFKESELNEGVYARQVAEAIGTRHQEVQLDEMFFVNRLESALESLDQPSFDGLNSYFMSQAVRDSGIKVALVGSGGDELFGGYKSFHHLPRMMSWSRWLQHLPRQAIAGAIGSLMSLLHYRTAHFLPQTRWAKLPSLIAAGGDLLAAYQLVYALFLPESQPRMLGSGFPRTTLINGLPEVMWARLAAEIAGRTPLSAISVLEQRLFLGERLLRDTDAVSMAASIEVRLPFVDSVLFGAVDRLNDRERFYPVRSKMLLRRLGLQGLDPALFNRPKAGFELPMDRWLRSTLGKQVESVMCDATLVAPTGLEPESVRGLWKAFLGGAPGLYWTRIWAVFVFIRWCHRHRVYL